MPVTYKQYIDSITGIVLDCYSKGIFPMGIDNENIDYFTADPRAIIPMNEKEGNFNTPRSLRQIIKKNIFEIRIDTCFMEVIKQCSRREPTWINKKIIDIYTRLHETGYAHSVETFHENKLSGGLYGVALKSAFFGESMFHIKSNASKVAVVKLYEMLKKNEFRLFDIQMMTPIFKIFGAVEIPAEEYKKKLKRALEKEAHFSIKN